MFDTLLICILIGACLIPLLTLWLAERNYRQLPILPSSTQPPTASVEIIVPARNETDVIERVVCSLKALDYPSTHLTVVDDSSEDDTGDKAKKTGADVLRLNGNPPIGWTGKCNASEQAVRHTHSEWILFTDADTYHAPSSLRDAIAYCETHRLDALSLLLQQECVTLWEKLILPLAYENYFATLNGNKTATFNGQYILIRREVYEQSGGFGAVRGRVMEDVALAEHLNQQGYRIALCNATQRNGQTAVSVRMYRSLPALLHGMTKTAYTAAKDRGLLGLLLGIVTVLSFLAIPAFMIGIVTQSRLWTSWGIAMLIASAAGLPIWMKRFKVTWWLWVWVSPIGTSLMCWIGFTSTLQCFSGRGVRWKGRTIFEAQIFEKKGIE